MFRVRQVLDEMNKADKLYEIKSYLPAYELPCETKGVFPQAILSSFESDKFSQMGRLTESLVLSTNDNDDPLTRLMLHLPSCSEETKEKIRQSKTTLPFLDKIEKTRQLINSYLRASNGSLSKVNVTTELQGNYIVGHPDAVWGSVVMEVKTTTKLQIEHPYFISQLSAYMALHPGYTHGWLILPLQCAIIEIQSWDNRSNLLDLLESTALSLTTKPQPPSNMLDLQEFVEFYGIGRHVSKMKTLTATVRCMSNIIPYQIFVMGNSSTHLPKDDMDIDQAGEWVARYNTRFYIHAPHVINLCMENDDDWIVQYMCKLFAIGIRMRASGIVVHVGKTKKQTVAVAMEKMTDAVFRILLQATNTCPLLLETPAGQGTELLSDRNDFVQFLQQFHGGEKLGACVDTCHVFASGYSPMEYVQYVGDRGLLRLVHYNDSHDEFHSCKDRHEIVGRGKIGLGEMIGVADYCGANSIPMVIE
jgi:endonuclease IV